MEKTRLPWRHNGESWAFSATQKEKQGKDKKRTLWDSKHVPLPEGMGNGKPCACFALLVFGQEMSSQEKPPRFY